MSVFIQKGAVPLTVRQAWKRGEHILELQMPRWQRELEAAENTQAYQNIISEWAVDNPINAANNLFNHQLAGYRVAVARLAKYELSIGRDEITEEIDTGEIDEDGNPTMETVVVSQAIPPLDATVEQTVVDEEGNETVVTVPNPLIVADEAERAAAQAVVDATDQDVKDFDGTNE